MKNVEDLVSSARTVYSRYAASRMERETVREWVLGLGDYAEPHGSALREAKAWFKPIQPESQLITLKPEDLERLLAVVEARATGTSSRAR
jgi:hypothetical protein